MREIVVPLDRSPLAERAVPVAGAVAAETGAAVRLVEVAPAHAPEAAADYLRATADALLPGSDVDIAVIEAAPGASVAETLLGAVGPDPSEALLCMTTHGRSGVGSVVLGSTAEGVLRRTREPLLMVGHRSRLPWPGQGHVLLVPIDGEHLDHDLMRAVAEVVGRTRLDPVLLKVAHSFDVEDAHHPTAGLDEAAEQLASLGVEAKVIHRFSSNLPIAIAEVADELGAALIVMATHVAPGAPRVLLGSVTMRTVHEAPCPTLVYPEASPDPA